MRPESQGLSGPNPFTISDLSFVWIVCDVYENDLDAVRVGDTADIRLNAYPGKVFKGGSITSCRFSIPISAPRKFGLKFPTQG